MDVGTNLTNSTPNVEVAPSNVAVLNPGINNIIAAALVALLIVVALGGNLIVITSFYTFRNLRTKCNFFIISLAISDILVALVAMPFWLTIQLTRNDWIYDKNLKTFWDCMDILCGTASNMNLAAVSFDRQLAITSPFNYPKILTSRRAIYIIVFVWLYAVLISCAVLIKSPAHKWPYPNYLRFVATVSFFLPLLIMLVMYTRIYVVARYQARKIGRNYATDIKAAKTIAVVIGGFVICWLPFFIVVLLYANNKNAPFTFLNVAKWLAYLNSCLNPVIYTCLNRSYRRAFRKLFIRCRSKIMREQRDHTSGSIWMSMAETQAAAATRIERDYLPTRNGGRVPNSTDSQDVKETLTVNETLTVV